MQTQKYSHQILMDFETSGTDKFTDQILEASLRVISLDSGLEVDSFQACCRSESFKVPSPEALFVNNYSIDDLATKEHPLVMADALFSFIKKYPNSEVIIFNSNFDFSFSYQAFYQRFKSDPYCLKSDGRSIICLMEVARAIEAMAYSTSIQVPLIEGARSFKQQDICAASGIFYAPHRADSDVQAMQKLLRLVEDHHPDYLEKARFFSKKQNAIDFIYSRSFFVAPVGFRNRYTVRCLVPLALCEKRTNLLAVDIGQYSTLDLQSLTCSPASDISRKYLIEPEPHYPIVEIPLNRSKLFFDESFYQASEFGRRTGKKELLQRAAAIFKDAELQDYAQRIHHFKKLRFDALKRNNLEESLFDYFPNDDEISFVTDLEKVPLENKYDSLINDWGHFKSNRFHKLARRFYLDAYPDRCPETTVSKYNDWRRDLLFGLADKNFRTFLNARNEIETLKNKYPNSLDRIQEIENYLSFREYEVENA